MFGWLRLLRGDSILDWVGQYLIVAIAVILVLLLFDIIITLIKIVLKYINGLKEKNERWEEKYFKLLVEEINELNKRLEEIIKQKNV